MRATETRREREHVQVCVFEKVKVCAQAKGATEEDTVQTFQK